MQQVARETWVAFERRLKWAQVPAFVLLRPGKPAPKRSDYHKWTRCYLDFCHKYSASVPLACLPDESGIPVGVAIRLGGTAEVGPLSDPSPLPA